jgi:hypothetical protein
VLLQKGGADATKTVGIPEKEARVGRKSQVKRRPEGLISWALSLGEKGKGREWEPAMAPPLASLKQQER